MRMIGIIGGIGPESTIDYYRGILALAKEKLPGAEAPRMVITSLDPFPFLGLLHQGDYDEIVRRLVREAERLATAGAEFAFIAANTPHVVFDRIAKGSPIPLVSIVEATCAEAARLGLRKVGLLGTRFTMEGAFYPDVFARQGLTVVRPQPAEIDAVHRVYVEELLHNRFLPESRAAVQGVIERLHARDGAEAVILGGTELPILLRDGPSAAVPLLDTTVIHVAAVVGAWLEGVPATS